MFCLRCFFFFSSRRRHTRFDCDWSSDVCSSDLFARRNAHLFAGAGIAADAGLARLHTEDAEAAEFDALAAAESLLQRFEDGLDGLLGFGAADVRLSDDSVYDIQLNHAILPRFRARC